MHFTYKYTQIPSCTFSRREAACSRRRGWNGLFRRRWERLVVVLAILLAQDFEQHRLQDLRSGYVVRLAFSYYLEDVVSLAE